MKGRTSVRPLSSLSPIVICVLLSRMMLREPRAEGSAFLHGRRSLPTAVISTQGRNLASPLFAFPFSIFQFLISTSDFPILVSGFAVRSPGFIASGLYRTAELGFFRPTIAIPTRLKARTPHLSCERGADGHEYRTTPPPSPPPHLPPTPAPAPGRLSLRRRPKLTRQETGVSLPSDCAESKDGALPRKVARFGEGVCATRPKAPRERCGFCPRIWNPRIWWKSHDHVGR